MKELIQDISKARGQVATQLDRYFDGTVKAKHVTPIAYAGQSIANLARVEIDAMSLSKAA